MRVRFLVEGDDSNGSVAVFETEVPADARMPAPHSHDGYEETVYGLEGTVTFSVDGESTDIGPGEVLCIKRGAVHAFTNGGDTNAKVLAVVTPGILGPGFFREVGAVLADAGSGPPDVARIG